MPVFDSLHADCLHCKTAVINNIDVSSVIAVMQETIHKQQEKIDQMQNLLDWSADAIEKLSNA